LASWKIHVPTPAPFGFFPEIWRLRVADFAVLVTLTSLARAPLSKANALRRAPVRSRRPPASDRFAHQ
jgi:hypothetical protein